MSGPAAALASIVAQPKPSPPRGCQVDALRKTVALTGRAVQQAKQSATCPVYQSSGGLCRYPMACILQFIICCMLVLRNATSLSCKWEYYVVYIHISACFSACRSPPSWKAWPGQARIRPPVLATFSVARQRSNLSGAPSVQLAFFIPFTSSWPTNSSVFLRLPCLAAVLLLLLLPCLPYISS